MAGQRIMAGFDGTCLNPDLRYLIDTIRAGGIILFSRNIESRRQLCRLCSDAQDYALSCGNPPLFIAVDQEGGSVARLKGPDFTELPDAALVKDPGQAAELAEITASELSAVGINMNMAPVLDVADTQGASLMAKRSFGSDPYQVAKTGAAVISHLQKNGIMAVAKHFPGIGRTELDSHFDRPDLGTSEAEIESRDLVPFYAAIEHNVAGMMLSHVRYKAFDSYWPASLSPAVAGDRLRGRMGYDGLVITDDLEMGAVSNYYDMRTAARQILAAGIDIALVCHNMAQIEAAYESILSGSGNPDFSQQSAESVSRVLAIKEQIPTPVKGP